MTSVTSNIRSRFLFFVLFAFIAASSALTQTAVTKAERGSQIAKAGFKNEDEIAAKFRAWRDDPDSRDWLRVMGHKLEDVTDVATSKPHGEKADITVAVTSSKGTIEHGISIKLVSSPNGFNQIDKRWLRQYVKLWSMPTDVESALKLFLGEAPPSKPSRVANRMFLTELDPTARNAVVDFFTANKARIVSDLIAGDGEHAADWIMVAFKATSNTRWTLKSTDAAAAYFADGKVEVTRAGNLKIGRVSMQRKGGDGGRETAKMLQFKINPVQLFEAAQ